MLWEEIYILIVAAVGLFALYMSVRNLIFIYRNSLRPFVTNGPMVSVLIPVRNEEHNIGPCLDSLLNQTYSNYEIVVLDDISSDKTWEILSRYEAEHSYIRIVRGKPLPEDWYGKNHALHQLAAEATGEILLFTDADTIHKKESVSFAVTNLEYHDVDFLSGYPRQNLSVKSIGPVLSLMFLNMVFFTPVWIQKKIQHPIFGLAIGQYLCIRAAAYWTVGGYASIPKVLTDDIHMGRLLIRNGFRQVFLRIGTVVSCTMYDSFQAAIQGITKCIFDFFDKKMIILIFLIPAFLFFVTLPSWLFIFYLLSSPISIPFLLYVGVVSLCASWIAVLAFNHFPIHIALLYPWSFSLVIYMLLRGIYFTLTEKGFLWKNRIVK
ncbi:MAG: glycosyltransferase [Spirochaetales bacterium]|nr:glycosyltransferase [Spirochaetales bacterium]